MAGWAATLLTPPPSLVTNLPLKAVIAEGAAGIVDTCLVASLVASPAGAAALIDQQTYDSCEGVCLSPAVAAVVFVFSLALTLAASEVLVRGLDRLGARVGLSEGLLGLLTALGADTPEISAALAALHAGARDVGLGVVLGSNIFNLAALLGLGAVLAGRVRVRREGLLLDGGVAFAATLLAAALVPRLLSPVLAVAALIVLFVPYLVVLAVPPRRLFGLTALDGVGRFLAVAVSEVDHEAAEDPRVGQAAGPWRPVFLILPALAVIVGGSVGLVQAALTLAAVWRLPAGLVGAVVLAGLTSLPNAYAAARLALQGRGVAVVSETLNSNTINILAGVALPALVYGPGSAAGGTAGGTFLDLAWLLGMTALVLALLARPRGLTRPGGVAVIIIYLLFVVVRVR